MVNHLRQAHFAAADFTSARFNLHAAAQAAPRRQLVVLVHGLGGSGYGTWGPVPEALFSGATGEPVDIGLFDYRSGHRRLFKGTADFKFWSRQLGAQLRELENSYPDIFLIGHSMGGILIEDVAMHYLIDRHMSGKGGSGSLAALVYVASPRAGSGWAIPLLSSLVYEFRILRRLSARDAEVDNFYSSRVERLNVATAAAGRTVLPTYAALAASDRLVNRFSATLGIPSTQQLYLEGTHTSIVKPSRVDKDLVAWMTRDVIEARSEVRKQAAREVWHNLQPQRSQTPEVRTKFVSQPSDISWTELYHDVRSGFATSSIRVRDTEAAPEAGGRLDLIIGACDADSLLENSKSIGTLLSHLEDDVGTHPSALIGVCPVGANYKSAVSAIVSEIPNNPQLYVIGAADLLELRAVMDRLMRLAIRRTADAPYMSGLEGLDSFDSEVAEGEPDGSSQR